MTIQEIDEGDFDNFFQKNYITKGITTNMIKKE